MHEMAASLLTDRDSARIAALAPRWDRINRIFGIWFILLILSDLTGLHAATLLPFGSGWAYFDRGYRPAPDWMLPDYDSGDWDYGSAQFGYGNGNEQTLVSYGPDDENKYITTYFRPYIYVPGSAQLSTLALNLLRDDGAVIYINGNEAFRSNMPDDEIDYGTFALTKLTYPAETELNRKVIDASLLVPGWNVIAAEVHQYEPASPDLSFDLEITSEIGGGALSVTRGPYLQVGTSSNIVVRWRTSVASSTRVLFGTNLADLNLVASNATLATEHEVTLSGLWPDTKYFYAIGTSTQMLAGDATYFFVTSPAPGPARSTRIWAIGDFGTGYPAQQNVRDAYLNFTGQRYTDVWLMLGDNAYYSGLDYEYQAYVFNVYPSLLRQTVVWPTVGNHETAQSQTLSDNYDYYRIFTMPANGQAGGVASGTEHYYSYDYANIHFVCLDSMTAVYRQPDSPMAQWIRADLAETTKDWIIVYFHHPAYTKGSHDSDLEGALIEMRENIVPILESFGVDLILSGHSHAYERSFLIDGFYGLSTSVNETNFIDHGDGRVSGTGPYLKPAGGLGVRRGLVYVVDGSSGGQGGGGSLNHPAMYYSVLTPGSLVLDVNGLRLDATFLSGSGTVDDAFTILKGDYPGGPPVLDITRAGTNAVISWPTSIANYQLQSKPALEAAQWTSVTAAVSTNGRRRMISVPAIADSQFFQLRRVP